MTLKKVRLSHSCVEPSSVEDGAAHSLPFVLIFSTKQSYGPDLTASPEEQGPWCGGSEATGVRGLQVDLRPSL